jgi:hypothetical protein
MAKNKKQKRATGAEDAATEDAATGAEDAAFEAKLVVPDPCDAQTADGPCSNYSWGACPGGGKYFCWAHRGCIQPPSVLAYQRSSQAYAYARTILSQKRVPEHVIESTMKMVGKPPFPGDASAMKWIETYSRYVSQDVLALRRAR